jgi:vancomycin resistance protein YoaR
MVKGRFVKNNKGKLIGSVVLSLCIIIVGVMFLYNKYMNTSTIPENIYIERTYVGNLTKSEAITKLEKRYIPKTIKLTYEDKIWSIEPDQINLKYNIKKSVNNAYNYTRDKSYIKNISRMIELHKGNKKSIKLEAIHDEAKLSEIMQNISNDINVAMKDATLNVEDSGAIKTTEAREGKQVDIGKTKEFIYNNINEKEFGEIEIIVNTVPPNITTEDVKSVDTVLAQFTTTFNQYSSDRAHNISKAGQSTNNIVLMPGEEFSYNNLTGPRTGYNGYRNAPVIRNGKLQDGEGGGVCQVSTTIYNAALYAGLEITEVRNHSLPSHYAPKGRDATVAYGYLDFKFENPYNHPIYIKNIIKNGHVTTKIYGCSKDRQIIQIKTEQKREKDNYVVKTYRIFRNSQGKEIKTELISTSKYKIEK